MSKKTKPPIAISLLSIVYNISQQATEVAHFTVLHKKAKYVVKVFTRWNPTQIPISYLIKFDILDFLGLWNAGSKILKLNRDNAHCPCICVSTKLVKNNYKRKPVRNTFLPRIGRPWLSNRYQTRRCLN